MVIRNQNLQYIDSRERKRNANRKLRQVSNHKGSHQEKNKGRQKNYKNNQKAIHDNKYIHMNNYFKCK